jgi:hypothetical protein
LPASSLSCTPYGVTCLTMPVSSSPTSNRESSR